MNSRSQAAIAIADVLAGRSLSASLPPALAKLADRDRGFCQALCFGTLRYYPAISLIIEQLIARPIKAKELEVQALIAAAIYQLWQLDTAPHAAINESVEACRALKKPWAVKLVNAVLRNFTRRREEILVSVAEEPEFESAHPAWLAGKIRKSWPDQWREIIAANNLQAPLTLRVNRRMHSRDSYLKRLADAGVDGVACRHSDDGITLAQACDVTELPGFADGWLSVQDEAAQLSAQLLELAPGQRVLDSCSAPGGKTCHILEREPALAGLLALDSDPSRLQRVHQNLTRLGLEATTAVANASAPESWWDGQLYDRILLDAPCSASGVIRRHPDIKLLRRPADIDKLAVLQQQMLQALWPTLAEGGLLLYATCSVLRSENDRQLSTFLAAQTHARCEPIVATWGIATEFGRQLLPQANGHDGFYYAKLRKLPS
ncbi:16S rRNA (cytosine(967)-C(5))-methyltransferase RsmB [Porticoccaceae bacterium]|nr:16S rRNA (cytosine(967)-C(5))-methyltransferase RsmB [Porticoccaceae bacterium]